MPEYQLASDGYDGTARSGVIRGDGKWVPCEAGNPDWYEYVAWLEENPDNRPKPFARPEHGGVAIKLDEGQSAVGSMLDSVEMEDMPPPVEEPYRRPRREDQYTPPPVPTDASRSPTRDQRSDSYRPLTDEERAQRDRPQPPVEGVWTGLAGAEADRRRQLEREGKSSQEIEAELERERNQRTQQHGQQTHAHPQAQPARPHHAAHAHDDAQRDNKKK